MTAYERLMAEAIPTGDFGGHRPTTDPAKRPWTPQEQLDHRRALEDALDNWHSDYDPRHLRAVRDQEHAA